MRRCKISARQKSDDSRAAEKEVTSEEQTKQVMGALQAASPDVKLERNEFVGPQIGQELATSGLMALLFVCVGIVIICRSALSGNLRSQGFWRILHDVIIILGFFAFFQWEFSLSVLAAVLAILGYSVNESVVIFDRIREVFRDNRTRGMSVAQVMNHAITSTMSRTIITHGSTEMMVLSMLIFGGPTLHYFALALTIGIVFGIYSSVFVAAALAMWFGVSRKDLELSAEDLALRNADRRDPNLGADLRRRGDVVIKTGTEASFLCLFIVNTLCGTMRQHAILFVLFHHFAL